MKRKLTDNFRRVKDRMANACIRAGREPDEITLLPVTKSVGVDVIRQLLEMGYQDIGESRVLELTRRAAMLKEMGDRMRSSGKEVPPRPRWHMVGHLQRNKVRQLLPWVDMIHSLDSLRLAEEIDTQAQKLGKTVDVLVQVNAAGERQKFGVAVGAVSHLAEQIATLPQLRVCGLMAMAPLTEDSARIAWTFERSKDIFDDMCKERFLGPGFRHLSMGMTNDFEPAIEHGHVL